MLLTTIIINASIKIDRTLKTDRSINHLIERIGEKMYRELKSPLVVQLELTTECNHRCIHCYNHWRNVTAQQRTLSVDEIKAIITNLKESEVPSLLITGGEPMLYPDLMIKAFEFGKEMGIKCSLNSNVTLATSGIAKELKRLGVGVLTSILSYDADTHDRITTSAGSFDRLVKGIRILQGEDIPISANMVVMKINAGQIYETGRFVHSLGVSGFRATKVHPAQGAVCFDKLRLPPEKMADIFDKLIMLQNDFGLKVDSLTTYPICLLKNLELYGQFLLKRGCSAGKTGCTIGADGQVRPCGHSDDNYGNAIKESLLQIWPRLKEWRDGSLLPKECKECKYVVECSGGCRMDCKFCGKIDSMDPYATGKDFVLIPQNTKMIKPLSFEAKLVINSSLCLRSEKFGFVVIVDGRSKSIVTSDTARILRELVGTVFSLDSILGKYTINRETLCSLFSSLYRQKVVCLYKPE